ncbi:hypothetical protein CY34DRAFT_274306 [Suillus luteus UH-Slu-Lm8-n1]|uniref:Uncharacterized protein n=1 Tax=Suillus luteus UH-Slu-Lm8-n1 TaxID=930992 RepID=A0A0D0B199_9AGAM|nr:hypothetical protein CY34DRAFT_274306 [Suillus luteus UH-Slu-Lm8-n1]
MAIDGLLTLVRQIYIYSWILWTHANEEQLYSGLHQLVHFSFAPRHAFQVIYSQITYIVSDRSPNGLMFACCCLVATLCLQYKEYCCSTAT